MENPLILFAKYYINIYVYIFGDFFFILTILVHLPTRTRFAAQKTFSPQTEHKYTAISNRKRIKNLTRFPVPYSPTNSKSLCLLHIVVALEYFGVEHFSLNKQMIKIIQTLENAIRNTKKSEFEDTQQWTKTTEEKSG